jgi:transcriptional regulator with XRE-family HTH domain
LKKPKDKLFEFDASLQTKHNNPIIFYFLYWNEDSGERGVQPPANTLKKLADVLDTTVDYLVSGDKDEKVKASLKDAELLQQFKAVEQFTDDDKSVVKKLIDAFIVKKQLQQMAS